jgi:hypothetical protein
MRPGINKFITIDGNKLIKWREHTRSCGGCKSMACCGCLRQIRSGGSTVNFAAAFFFFYQCLIKSIVIYCGWVLL